MKQSKRQWLTQAQKRRARKELIDVATQIFCSGVEYAGRRVSISDSIDYADSLIYSAGKKIEEVYTDGSHSQAHQEDEAKASKARQAGQAGS